MKTSSIGPIANPLTSLVVTDERFVKVRDESGVHYALNVNTPSEVIMAANQIFAKHVVLPYNEMVIKALLTHPVHGKIFIVTALEEELYNPQSVAVRYNLPPERLFPLREWWGTIVNMLFDYQNLFAEDNAQLK